MEKRIHSGCAGSSEHFLKRSRILHQVCRIQQCLTSTCSSHTTPFTGSSSEPRFLFAVKELRFCLALTYPLPRRDRYTHYEGGICHYESATKSIKSVSIGGDEDKSACRRGVRLGAAFESFHQKFHAAWTLIDRPSTMPL